VETGVGVADGASDGVALAATLATRFGVATIFAVGGTEGVADGKADGI
jgi:hypothetical protein